MEDEAMGRRDGLDVSVVEHDVDRGDLVCDLAGHPGAPLRQLDVEQELRRTRWDALRGAAARARAAGQPDLVAAPAVAGPSDAHLADPSV